ncbi:SpoIIE family protein phosphatase [Thalassobacillus hwangdonensis]|uniref:SpoIIE family protein phosphatase n=1 Tax=Thalassobacillus hwangdonensis TaxID=546108 RepID=A0ABW3L061_9BACI
MSEQPSKRLNVQSFQKAKKGNYYCGDSYFYKETEDAFVCALADGLGSGELAMDSSKAVIKTIEDNPELEIEPLINKCNESLAGKRGVVLGILRIEFKSNTYSYSSIGNIGIMMITGDGVKKRNIPQAGYLSGFPRKLGIMRGTLTPNMMFIMFSDGVDDRQLSSGLFKNGDPSRIIDQFKNDNAKLRQDDTTLIAIKYD